MNKKLRQQVYDKCNGHCGYCGRAIEYKAMQVDHIFPKCCRGGDTIENLMPTCRRCNHYKRANTLENFRNLMMSLHQRLGKIYILSVAVNFGMCEVKPFDGVFYFERLKAVEKAS